MKCPNCDGELEDLPSYRHYCPSCDIEGELFQFEKKEV